MVISDGGGGGGGDCDGCGSGVDGWSLVERSRERWARLAAMLAVNSHTPDALLQRLAQSEDVLTLVSLGGRAGLPKAVVRRLLGHPDSAVRERLLDRSDRAVEIRIALHNDPDPAIRSACVEARFGGLGGLGDVPELPHAVYARLAIDLDPKVRRVLTLVPHLPDDLVELLARDRDRLVRLGLLQRWSTLPAVARTMLEATADEATRRDLALYVPGHRPTPEVRRALLDDPSSARRFALVAPLDAAEAAEFAGHPDPGVRAAVAANPTLPASTRVLLAEDVSATVRSHVAMRPDVGPEECAAIRPWPADAVDTVDWLVDRLDDVDLLLRYLDSPHPAFRRSVACSPALPSYAVARLGTDPDHRVRRILAEHHPDAPTQPLVGRIPPLRRGPGGPAIDHPRFPPAALRRFADSRDPHLRALAALSRRSSPDLVERLSHDPESRVRVCAAGNARLSRSRALALLGDPDPRVAEAVVRYTRLPEATMSRILARAGL
ncbi:hypothetical protein ACIRL2_09040 [Embleya sp. NPDC127516]|uniref:hypothetical protein n=1 Tax=Embleya sp. NPDC127516 TaxID=3363990 RepID=UPI0038015B3B